MLPLANRTSNCTWDLVETSVGLLPAGGGCKEMTLRAIEIASAVRKGQSRSDSVEMHDALRTVFETIAMAKVSSSAVEAKTLHLMRESDGITMNRDRLLLDAKSEATRLADTGYVPPLPADDIPAPGENMLANLKLGIHMMREAEFISDHDVKIARKVAHVLCGGPVTPGRTSVNNIFWIWSAKHFCRCAENRRRWSVSRPH